MSEHRMSLSVPVFVALVSGLIFNSLMLIWLAIAVLM